MVAVTDERRRDELAAAVPARHRGLAGPGVLADLARAPTPSSTPWSASPGSTSRSPPSPPAGASPCQQGVAHRGGPVVQAVRNTPGAELVPVDSEHSRCTSASASEQPAGEVTRIVLTASGGPFRGRTLEDLAGITVEEALAHPTWAMGPKITVDSSTLMNKGLEVIEAHELFGTSYDRVEVVVHPQSVVHSMVEFTDGATVAQLSLPDMRLCIGYALAWPERLPVPYGRIDWAGLEPPRLRAARPRGLPLPAPRLRRRAGRRAGPGGAQRRQRGGRRRLPRRRPGLDRHPRRPGRGPLPA